MTHLLTAIGLTPGGNSTVQYSTVDYTFTHKQYTERQHETEYLEQNTVPRIVGSNPAGVVDICLL